MAEENPPDPVMEEPDTINFDDEEPKKDFAKIMLKIPKLIVKKSLLGKPHADNAEFNSHEKIFQERRIEFEAIISNDEGKKKVCYHRDLPAAIDKEKSYIKLKKDSCYVSLCLCKVKSGSWTQYERELVQPN